MPTWTLINRGSPDQGSTTQKMSQPPPPGYSPNPQAQPQSPFPPKYAQGNPQQGQIGSQGPQGPPGTFMAPAGHQPYGPGQGPAFNGSAPFPSYPNSMVPVMSDLEKIKNMEYPCMAQCPHCRYVGMTIVDNKFDMCYLILGIFTLPLGILIIIYLASLRVHICTRCNGEITRKRRNY